MVECYGIMDKKVGSFGRPFFAKNLVEVVRGIEQELRNPESSLSLYPGDFALYQFGSFDEIEGIFVQSRPEHKAEIMAFVTTIGKKDLNVKS